jgi:integrase
MHADGAGLWLQVKPGSDEPTRCWIYRYTVDGKQKWMGLGPFADVSLARAREKAADARRLRLEGGDPLDAKRAARASLRQRAAEEKAKSMTLAQCADGYFTAQRSAWTPKHANGWLRMMEVYVLPMLGPLTVGTIDTAAVMKVLEADALAQMPNAQARIRRRLEVVIDWAKARGYFLGSNPAQHRGHLDKLLPKPAKLRVHYPAMPYAAVPGFLASLRLRESITARALEFVILTAARSGEVLGARWDEIDLLSATWTVPAERMKSRRPHRVPLSPSVVSLLDRLLRSGEYVFAGNRGRMHAYVMAELMRSVTATGSPHGFRSSFRDWCSERTNYPSEVAEMALAHVVGHATEAAYRWGDLFERRRRLMSDWADFCDGKTATGAEVVPLRAAGGN